MVSIIVPVFNAQKYLSATIESALNQTYGDWELLIIDDGSADKSLEIARAFANKDTRIKLLFHPGNRNLGVGASRNVGLKQSTGEYIALLDSDDIWFANKLELQMACFNSSPTAGVVYSKLKTKFDAPNPGFPEICGSGTPGLNKEFHKDLLQWDSGWIPNSSIIFKKSLLKNTGGFKSGLKYQIEDSIFFTLLACYADCYFLDEILGYYRIHDASYTFNSNWRRSYHEYYRTLLFSKSMKRKDLVISWYLKKISKNRSLT